MPTGRGRIVALIPARGGSKGIPRKNLISIGGKPLIAHSILQARQSRHIDRVIVSSEDQEIADVARHWGADVPFLRPVEYAGDLSTDLEVFQHALDWLVAHEPPEPELVVHLRPTGPVRRVPLIDAAIEMIVAHPDADALRSVMLAQQTPYKMWRVGPDGFLDPVLRVDQVADCQSQPRQLLPAIYWQNGYVDIVRPRTVREKRSMWGDRALAFIVDEPMLELDYLDDIPTIEAALARLEQGLPVAGGQPRDSV